MASTSPPPPSDDSPNYGPDTSASSSRTSTSSPRSTHSRTSALACNLAGTTGQPAIDRATELLAHVGLADRLLFRPDQLSGGEKQRVAIARSLANHPTLVLADEPTANLDSSHGRDIARLLRQLARQQHCSIVIVSHDDRLREIADRVLWLEDGAFRQLDTMAIDPVCAMAVQPGDDTPHYQHDSTTYWFCSVACRQDFADDPSQYIRRTADTNNQRDINPVW